MGRSDAAAWADRLWRGWDDDLRCAFGFLTRVPLPGAPGEFVSGDLAGAARAFPVVGLAVGLAAAALFAIASGIGLSVWIASVLAIALQLLLTGALHEDGLSDMADGFGGGADKARKLEIMRDSRIGSYGVAALVLALTVRVAALAVLPGTLAAVAALAASGALSRTAMVFLMRWLEPAREDGLGADAGVPNTEAVVWAAVIAALVALVAFGPVTGIVAIAVAAGAVVLIGWLAKRQIGGHSGDVLGAVQQAAEIACLITTAAMLT